MPLLYNLRNTDPCVSGLKINQNSIPKLTIPAQTQYSLPQDQISGLLLTLLLVPTGKAEPPAWMPAVSTQRPWRTQLHLIIPGTPGRIEPLMLGPGPWLSAQWKKHLPADATKASRASAQHPSYEKAAGGAPPSPHPDPSLVMADPWIPCKWPQDVTAAENKTVHVCGWGPVTQMSAGNRPYKTMTVFTSTVTGPAFPWPALLSTAAKS